MEKFIFKEIENDHLWFWIEFAVLEFSFTLKLMSVPLKRGSWNFFGQKLRTQKYVFSAITANFLLIMFSQVVKP